VRRRMLAVMVVAAAVLLAVPLSASADKPGNTCPPGFDLGGLTADQALQLPNVQAGIAAGVYDEPFVRAVQDAVDRNSDGVICFKSYPPNANPASQLQYFYNVVDNNASVPSG
jgi:ABC-type sugar transport system substrate-binding protein